jgi:hypothetical protein
VDVMDTHVGMYAVDLDTWIDAFVMQVAGALVM